MNRVELIGRLARDPEVRWTQDGRAIGRFAVAINRRKDREGNDLGADFPTITVFGKQAENCEKYLQKGRLVGVSGRIRTGSYINKNGVKVYTTEVIADRVEFLEWGEKQDSTAREQNQPGENFGYEKDRAYGQSTQEETQQNIPSGFEAIEDDDIPF